MGRIANRLFERASDSKKERSAAKGGKRQGGKEGKGMMEGGCNKVVVFSVGSELEDDDPRMYTTAQLLPAPPPLAADDDDRLRTQDSGTAD
nr:hypothetical protein CFP56_59693 [Quercus suber]